MDKVLKPFAVNFELSAIVMATDAEHARIVARSHKSEIIGDTSDSDIDVTTSHAIASVGQLAQYGYYGDSLPYGGEDDTTLADIIEAMPAIDTKTVDMFAATPGDTPA